MKMLTYLLLCLTRGAGLLMLLGLTACGTVLHTQVQREHQWPAEMTEKTYTVQVQGQDPTQELAQTLQLTQLKSLLQEQLQKWGFVPAHEQESAHLLIQLRYAEQTQPVYQLDDVFFTPQHRFWGRGPWHGFAPHPAMYSHWGGLNYSRWYGYAGPHFYPGWWLHQPLASSSAPASFIYAPMLGGGPVYVYRESPFPLYLRMIQVEMSTRDDQKKVFQVAVRNASQLDLASAFGSRILPFMLESAFVDFPGVSGATQHFSLKLE